MSVLTLNRRALLAGGAGIVAVQIVPVPLRAEPEEMQAAIRAAFGDRPINEGKVTLKVPVLSENGNSVNLSIEVDSPMTEEDHVTSIQVFSPENPLPDVLKVYLGPRAGRARVTTRMRMADSQTVTAIAEMNDGSLWSGTGKTIVTIAACVDLG